MSEQQPRLEFITTLVLQPQLLVEASSPVRAFGSGLVATPPV